MTEEKFQSLVGFAEYQSLAVWNNVFFFFIFLLSTHYESTHKLCGEKWWPEIRLRSQAAPHVILPELRSYVSLIVLYVFPIFQTLNYFILPVHNKMFGVFRTKLQRQNQGFLGGLDSYSNLFEIDAKYLNYFKDDGRNSKNFRNAAKSKKSIQTVTNHVNSWSAKWRRGHSGALPQIYGKPVSSQHWLFF